MKFKQSSFLYKRWGKKYMVYSPERKDFKLVLNNLESAKIISDAFNEAIKIENQL